MDEKEFKPIAKQFLEQFGLKVFDIPTIDGILTPDFEVLGKGCKYVIELKIKSDDPVEIANDKKVLSRGEIVSKAVPVGPRNTLSGIIRDGVKQMMEHDSERKMFRVIWLHSAGLDPQHHFKRFQSTVYGTETLFSLHLGHLIECFFFHNSAFYAWRENLDGAILTQQNSAQLCINTLSPKVQEFRMSELVNSMAEGLCDPEKVDGIDNGFMIADCNIVRRDINSIIQYLQNKYQLEHLQTIPIYQHTGIIAVTSPEED